MPRPGARPYECVRRAWHSDRHQPMRGSLIQEIFRVVNEIHSSATRKNKEWQEKLPVVVLKAEEIMYSKANSEAEYIDLKTLWERANDAVNTIIRRDESMETGEFLQPCIEAALNLGCTPRRASRSQRHSNPRFYLNSGAQDNTVTSDAPKVVTNSMTREGSSSSLLPLQSVNLNSSPQFATFYSTSLTPKTINSTHLGSESNTTGAQVANKPKPHELTYSLPMACHMFPLSSEKDKSSLPMQTYSSSSLGCIYPLYYGTQLHQPLESQLTFQTPLDSNGNTVILGTPIAEAKTGFLKNLLGRNDGLEATVRSTLGNLDPPDAEFDLSLHLGPSSIPRSTSENCSAVEVEDVGLNNSHDGSKLWDLPPSKLRSSNFDFSPSFPDRDQGFCFFRTDAIDNPLESCSSKRSLEGEGLNVETPIKKRKAPIDDTVNNRQFWWQPNISSNQFFNSSKEPNL